MITIYYGMGDRDYTKIGDGVLCPTSCVLRQIAGGSYDLTMTHPLDPWDKWKLLQVGNIIKAPVQEETLENAYSGAEQWIYETNASAKLRATPEDPQTITYPAWAGTTDYTANSSKVSYYGKNYVCTYFDAGSGQRFVPPNNSPWWREIAGSTSGGEVVASLNAGTKLIWIEGAYADTWWKMATYYGGIVGWIKQSELTNEQHLTPEEVQPVTIYDQLFRVRQVNIDTSNNQVNVEAEHVSYDASAMLIQKAEIAGAAPALAIQKLLDGMYEQYDAGNIYTDLIDTSNGTYTKTIKGKSLTYALLDPDTGIVPTFDAELRRNNWDLYIMEKTEVDRGFRLTYGKNLRGVQWTKHDQDLITRIIPIAKNEAGEELYLDAVYVDSSHINDYPVIRMEQLQVSGQVGKDDGTGTDTTWTETTLKAEMQAKAEERYSVDHCDQPTVEITVDFNQLGDTAEYQQYRSLERALMYDIVRVQDDRIGLDAELRVTEIEWDAIREAVTGLKLSNVVRADSGTVAGYTVVNGAITATKMDAGAMTEIIDAAADRAIQTLS